MPSSVSSCVHVHVCHHMPDFVILIVVGCLSSGWKSATTTSGLTKECEVVAKELVVRSCC